VSRVETLVDPHRESAPAGARNRGAIRR
jgi:hypothetical protein